MWRVTLPNLVALGQTVLAYVGVQENFGYAGASHPRDRGMANPLETRYYAACATVLNLVDLSQTGWA